MEETIKHYQAILPCQDFILTGSYVNQMLLGMKDEKPGDLDIILVKPETAALETLKRLQEKISPELTSNPNYPTTLFRIKEGNLKIDFFIETTDRAFIVLKDNLKVTTILDTVSVKKSYGRLKDWLQLRKISRLFFVEEEFQKFLNNYHE